MKAQKIFLSVLIGILFIVNVASHGQTSFEQTGFGRVKGKVVEKGTNKPIAGAQVIYTVSSGQRRGSVCDAKGNFSTEQLGAGWIIQISVKAKGFYTLKKELIVGQGNREVVLEMVDQERARLEREKELARITPISRSFKIEHRDAREIFDLVQPISCAKSASSELQTITASGSYEALKLLEDLIKKYDTPLKQIWLEVLLIKATGNGGGKPKYPPEIDSIVNKLRSLFKFGKYSIIGRGNAMGLEGATLSFSGRIENDPEALVQHPFHVQTGLGSAGDVIKLQNLKVAITLPQNEIMTSINIKNGETVILGASRGKVGEDALITVVTAKIMQ